MSTINLNESGRGSRGTLVIAIGIADYASVAYPRLVGAAADLENIRRLFVDRGLPHANLRLLKNESATRRECLGALRTWASRFRLRDLRLFVFFSGHGLSTNEDGIATSVLLTHDTDPEDPTGTGIRIQDLADAINRARPREAYFFIDACEVGYHSSSSRLNFNQLSGLGSAISFGMFAAPGERAREGVEGGGLFTQAVVRALSTAVPQSCAAVAESVAAELEAIDCPVPDSLLRGNAQIRPMAEMDTSTVVPIVAPALPDVVLRPEACRRIIAELAVGEPVWLWGPSGRGKTFLIKHLAVVAERAVLDISVPAQSYDEIVDLRSVMDHLASEVAEQTPALFPDGRAPVDGLPGALRILASARTSTILVVDHLDRLDEADRRELAHVLTGAMRQNLILIGRTPPQPAVRVRLLEAPRLSNDDLKRFAAQYGSSGGTPSVESLRLISDGSPLKLRDFLASSTADIDSWFETQLSDDEELALTAVVASGGFVNLDVFANRMGISALATRQLIARGFIQLAEECYVAHDSIVEQHHFAQSDDWDNAALTYWCDEVTAGLVTPRASRAITQLVSRVPPSLEALRVLPLVVEELRLARDWTPLRLLIEVLSDSRVERSQAWVGAMIPLTAVFVRSVQHVEAALLMSRLEHDRTPDLHEDERYEVDVLEAERRWWHGEFRDALVLLDEVLGRRPSPAAFLSRGIAYWFLGLWDECDADFERARHDREASERTVGWAEIMLGSSLGLRGKDIQHVKMLFRDGIARLSRSSDDIGVAIGWGNLGEISWKLGEFEAAELQLRRGLLYAHEACGPQLILEMYRSILEVAMRLHGPWSEETQDALDKIDVLFDDAMGATVRMQLWNTLATLAVMRGDVEGATRYVSGLEPLTSENEEYHIYTLANGAGVAALTGDLAVADGLMREAFAKCRKAGNALALAQIAANALRLADMPLGLSEGQIELLRGFGSVTF